MKYKKVILKIIIIFGLLVFLFVGVKLIKNSFVDSNYRQIPNDNSSIIYFIDIDTLKRAEIRLYNIATGSNPLAVYVPFRISIDNIRYDDENLILGVKEYDCYSIITVFVTDDSQHIFLELINNNREMYNGISLIGNTQDGVRNVELRIKENELSNNLKTNNLLYIKHHFVNISKEVQIYNLSDENESYLKLSANEDYEIFVDNESYVFNYNIDGYVDEETPDSPIKIIFELVLIPVLLSITMALYCMCKNDEQSEEITTFEIVVAVLVFFSSIGGIVVGYIKKIETIYLIIMSILFLISLGGYMFWKRKAIKKRVEKFKNNTSKSTE